MEEDSEASASLSVGKFRSAIYESLTETLTEAVILFKDNIPGALLDGQDPSQLYVKELKRWLQCTSANQSGRKGDLVKQLVTGGIASYSYYIFTANILLQKHI